MMTARLRWRRLRIAVGFTGRVTQGMTDQDLAVEKARAGHHTDEEALDAVR